MTDDNSPSAQVFDCPAPDCSKSTGGGAELADHVNSEHAGEYKREDWPDTETAREMRASSNE